MVKCKTFTIIKIIIIIINKTKSSQVKNASFGGHLILLSQLNIVICGRNLIFAIQKHVSK